MTLEREVELLREKRDLLKEILELDRKIPARLLSIDPVIREMMLSPSCTPLS